LNDIVDAPLDAGQKPGKPIPRGMVTPRMAGLTAAVTGIVGLGLSLPSGPSTLVAALAVLALGYAYDLWLSRTRLSWLPLALALPVLPIHAWVGATGGVPGGLLPMLPVAVVAGFGLAIGNALVDLERDAATGRRGVAVALGPRVAWLAHAAALTLAALLAASLAPAPTTPPDLPGGGAGTVDWVGVLAMLRSVGLPFGIGALALGAGVLLSRRAAVRERGWELEAVGVAAIGIGWLAGIASVAA
jgi:4-hydroxybenzoate polyprenyltransferase